MNRITNFFGALKSSGTGMKARRVFNAYESKDYDAMISIVSTMTPSSFLKEIKKDDMSLLHHCAVDDNLEALKKLETLPYFKEIVNDDQNHEGWTPLLWAASQSNKSDL